jgi:hypothetical protein
VASQRSRTWGVPGMFGGRPDDGVITDALGHILDEIMSRRTDELEARVEREKAQAEREKAQREECETAALWGITLGYAVGITACLVLVLGRSAW